tara:strand:+ start:101 stop:478 length:378 start_codon:yes stop_codon:yes gene_type:complete
MKLVLKPYFILSVALYLLIRILRLFEIHIPEILNSHLTDFLFMPILLTVSLIGVRVIKRNKLINLTIGMIFVSTVFVSFMFEIIMPSRSSLFIKDYWDVVAYIIGALFFYIVQSRLEVQVSNAIG